MSTSAAAAGSNDTVVNSTAQELVCSSKIKITLIQDKYFNRKIKWDELFWRNLALFLSISCYAVLRHTMVSGIWCHAIFILRWKSEDGHAIILWLRWRSAITKNLRVIWVKAYLLQDKWASQYYQWSLNDNTIFKQPLAIHLYIIVHIKNTRHQTILSMLDTHHRCE